MKKLHIMWRARERLMCCCVDIDKSSFNNAAASLHWNPGHRRVQNFSMKTFFISRCCYFFRLVLVKSINHSHYKLRAIMSARSVWVGSWDVGGKDGADKKICRISQLCRKASNWAGRDFDGRWPETWRDNLGYKWHLIWKIDGPSHHLHN